MKIKVLLNPYSNRWNAHKRWDEAETALRKADVDFEMATSQHADHLTELAAEAVQAGFDMLVVAGGDGSIGEVINGAAQGWDEQHPFPVRLGLLPLGTANDLVDNVGLPTDLNAAANVIAGGKFRKLDLGICNDRYFLNNSAAGLEPYVTTKQEKIKRISGVPRYLLAAVQGILDRPEWQAQLEWDGGSYEGPLSLISVGNGRRTGGIFFMTPHADPFDGKLTFMHAYRKTRTGLFLALPHAMKVDAGNLAEQSDVYEIDCTRLRIRLDRPSPVHTDGELFDEWYTELTYRILPACVEILTT